MDTELVVVLSIVGSVVGFYFYFMPSFIAFDNNHRNFAPLLVLNIFLGWTLLGWVGALIWALIESQHQNEPEPEEPTVVAAEEVVVQTTMNPRFVRRLKAYD